MKKERPFFYTEMLGKDLNRARDTASSQHPTDSKGDRSTPEDHLHTRHQARQLREDSGCRDIRVQTQTSIRPTEA